jgi:hypothetical protein
MPALHFLIFTTHTPGAGAGRCAIRWEIPTNNHCHYNKTAKKQIFFPNNTYDIRNTKVS